MGHGYQLLSVSVKCFVMVKRMGIRGISFSHAKQEGFGEKIHSHNRELCVFFNVDT